jgi:hypothetical protein
MSEKMPGSHITPHQETHDEDDVYELRESQMITPEQEESMGKIADFDKKIATLKVIERSISQKQQAYGEHTNLGHEIEKLNKELSSKIAEGEDISDLEAELFEKKARHDEGGTFFGAHGQEATMFNRTSAAEFNQLRGNEDGETDESTQALLSTLEEMGLDVEKFEAELNQGPQFRACTDKESSKVSSLVKEFRIGLEEQRNNERLNLPNEQQKMVGELMQEARVADLDVIQIRRSTWRLSGKQLAESLYSIIPEPKDLDTYPDSVVESYFVQVASRLLEEDRGEEAEMLGKEFAQMHTRGERPG